MMAVFPVGHIIKMVDVRRPLAERKVRRAKGYSGYYLTIGEVDRGGRKDRGIGFYLMETPGEEPGRVEDANDHLSGARLSDTLGYYCDEYGDGDTLQPRVLRLARGRGWLAGWTMGEGMSTSFSRTVYDSPRDAAYAAHHKAEQDAETERAYQEEERERIEAEEAAEALAEEVAETAEALAELGPIGG